MFRREHRKRIVLHFQHGQLKMAGMDRYPLYSQDHQRIYERPVHDKYPSGDILRLQEIGPNTRVPSKSLEEPPLDDDDNDDELLLPRRSYDDFPFDDEEVTKYIGVGVGLASLITENLLSHPFVVLRRQCQVHNNSGRYHLVPITLLPVIAHLHKRQGITTLWKGLGSVLMIRGMTLAVEDLISKVTPWPKEVTWHSSLKSFGQHILLKCTTLAIVTPFYSASLVETVQSDIASEKPGIFDVFREGMCRLVSWGSPQKGRMLPVWALVMPTVMYGLLKYLFTVVVRGVASRVMHVSRRHEQEKQGALSRDMLGNAASQDIELSSALIGLITADIVFFPLETILHRLHLQGTRTIIDDLDSGYEVIPILTSYEGTMDCYEQTLQQEGASGLYKGFGALLLQFAAHVAVIKLTKLVLTELTNLLRTTPKPPMPQPDLSKVTTPLEGHSKLPPGYQYTQQTYLPYE